MKNCEPLVLGPALAIDTVNGPGGVRTRRGRVLPNGGAAELRKAVSVRVQQASARRAASALT
eukprot:3511909-Prymnesium_polylepis.1